jgi:flagellar basal-body rod protein FlgF/flagellar basal-body rod protein FlgG
MPYGLYISAEGAQVQSKRLEVIANNLANVDTTGFKRDLAVCQARLTEADIRGQDFAGSRTINDLSGGVQVAGTTTDFSMGPLKVTGQKTDLAIQGDGFFVVQKAGKQYLTRAGNFLFDNTGKLINGDGYDVLNDQGQPIQLDPEGGPFQFTPDGSVVQAGSANFLKMVMPRSLGDLVKVGENLYAPLASAPPLDPTQRRVGNGMLEGSSVKPTQEMMSLIECSRAFEANTNMIKHQDTVMGSLISRVLKD